MVCALTALITLAPGNELNPPHMLPIGAFLKAFKPQKGPSYSVSVEERWGPDGHFERGYPTWNYDSAISRQAFVQRIRTVLGTGWNGIIGDELGKYRVIATHTTLGKPDWDFQTDDEATLHGGSGRNKTLLMFCDRSKPLYRHHDNKPQPTGAEPRSGHGAGH